MSQSSRNKESVVARDRRVMDLGIAEMLDEEDPKVKIEKTLPTIGLNGKGIQGIVSNMNEPAKLYQNEEIFFGGADALNTHAGVYFHNPITYFRGEHLDRLLISNSRTK
jgi:hypothetical protein